MVEVDIALGLYNGIPYLNEFLVSLEKQVFANWRLVVRDDGSNDNSLDIIKEWALHNKRPLKIIEDSFGNLKVINNFSTCLNHTEAPYVMLADQDDVWFPYKISDAIAAIKIIESESPIGTPIAVYCDLQVVDAELNVIFPSMLRMQQQDMRRLPSLPQLLSQNVAPGCSMIVNRALLTAALPIPKAAVMHDWWLMLIAQTFGKIGHIQRPGIAYRQHESNQVGAKQGNLLSIAKEVFHAGLTPYLLRLEQSLQQANALAELVPANHPYKPIIKLYAELKSFPPLLRQIRACRAGISKVGPLRNFIFYCLM